MENAISLAYIFIIKSFIDTVVGFPVPPSLAPGIVPPVSRLAAWSVWPHRHRRVTFECFASMDVSEATQVV